MKSVAFHNLGCKVNTYELDVMQQKFSENGYRIVPFGQIADIYVVNTCTVTNIADRKSRQMLHKAKKQNPQAIVVGCGCYIQTDTDTAAKDDAVDIVIGNNHKTEIVEIVEEYMAHECRRETAKTVVSDLCGAVEYEKSMLEYSSERTRVDVKIQDGCNQFCSYCIIPYSRGRIRSREIGDIKNEIERLAGRGYKEVVLTGIHLSSYGLDFNIRDDGRMVSYNSVADNGEYTNHELLQVIDEVSKIDGISRIRLGSLEPRIITEEFLENISRNEKVCPHFHLSLQSGCDAVLARMNRHYTCYEYYEKVKLIRSYYAHPAITTDIIVGFPGETETEFEETVRFVEKVHFYEIHVFKYSRRHGTVADRMEGQITDAIKTRRSAVLLEIDARNRSLFANELLGTEVVVLLEEPVQIDGETYMLGHTRDYVAAVIKSDSLKENEIVKGTAISEIGDGYLLIE